MRRKFQIVSAYDTETTNIGVGENTRAFPILFIDNDLRDIDLKEYDISHNKINLYRTETEMLDRIAEYIMWGKIVGKVPIICAYNLMFDLKPLMQQLDTRYDIEVNAQSSTNVYTLDLYEADGNAHLLRFWDTFHLEMRGLAAMGRTAGLPKADGEWDYGLIRTPETPLTEEEIFYAKRDVQVIPAYLKYLLNANEWMKQEDFGNRILTKTSIVRQMARRNISNIKVEKRNGKLLTLDKAFTEYCMAELPSNFNIYGLRKACFRGGFTFTAARYASTIQRRVYSADVTSMHHTFINGRYTPQNFEICGKEVLQMMCERIIATPREEIFESYHRPFYDAIHARIEFTNLRLRKDSAFEHYDIGLLSTAKFKRKLIYDNMSWLTEMNIYAENETRKADWVDSYDDAELAFGKLMSARSCTVHVTELELWCISRVYEWDKMEVICGEASIKWRKPPDFVTLQSNMLFEQKSSAKFIQAHYEEGTPYAYNLTNIPDGIANALRDGTCEAQFFDSWYSSTVKGMFNGIYGTQAQDIYKGNYTVENGELLPDESSVTTAQNWDEKQPKTTRVLYTYGMRIVGGSRLHMVLAIELIYERFGDKARVLGGDTDSMKISVDDGITGEDISNALEPLAIASKRAIDVSMQRVRKLYPKLASTLKGIGAFEIENDTPYECHLELWNKARVSYEGGKFHVTCAGLSRPLGKYNIETMLNDLSMRNSPDRAMMECIGYNTYISNTICHALEHHIPKSIDMVDEDVTDYMGNTTHVTAHESISLRPVGRWIGEILKIGNMDNVRYLRKHYDRIVNDDITELEYDGNPHVIRNEMEVLK